MTSADCRAVVAAAEAIALAPTMLARKNASVTARRQSTRRPRVSGWGESCRFGRGHRTPFGVVVGVAFERESDTYVQSLARGLSVICAFGPGHGAMTLSEVAEAAGVTRAGARRILLTLQSLGYVTLDGRLFRLSPKILNLGYSYLSSLDFWSFAEPIMEALVERVHESCSASVLDGDDIVYVLRVPTRRIMSINLGIGSRLPAYAASMGRVLLAALSDAELDDYLANTKPIAYTKSTVSDTPALRAAIVLARERGWALVDQELEEGLRSIAVPIVNRSGRTIGALNISAHASRVPIVRMVEELLPELQRAKREIDEALRLQS